MQTHELLSGQSVAHIAAANAEGDGHGALLTAPIEYEPFTGRQDAFIDAIEIGQLDLMLCQRRCCLRFEDHEAGGNRDQRFSGDLGEFAAEIAEDCVAVEEQLYLRAGCAEVSQHNIGLTRAGGADEHAHAASLVAYGASASANLQSKRRKDSWLRYAARLESVGCCRRSLRRENSLRPTMNGDIRAGH